MVTNHEDDIEMERIDRACLQAARTVFDELPAIGNPALDYRDLTTRAVLKALKAAKESYHGPHIVATALWLWLFADDFEDDAVAPCSMAGDVFLGFARACALLETLGQVETLADSENSDLYPMGPIDSALEHINRVVKG